MPKKAIQPVPIKFSITNAGHTGNAWALWNAVHRAQQLRHISTTALWAKVIAVMFVCLGGGFQTSNAQIDSTYTVPPPVGYQFFFDSAVVEAATSAPAIYQLQFDTTDALHLTEDMRGGDHTTTATPAEIMDRLSCIESEIPLNYHERVKVFIDYFTLKKRDFTLRVLERKHRFFPMFERTLAENGAPQELKYLAIIESALVPVATSRVGARGLWQFMPYTGRMMGLKQDYYIDERLDPEKATAAAAKYLLQLYGMFGDWELAIASYNCGPGNVRKAQRRSGKFHFWDIYHKLPRETRSYLPQFVAMCYVLNYAEEHNLMLDKPKFFIPTEQITVEQPVSMGALAKGLNVCMEDFRLLNPEVYRDYVPKPASSYTINIPKLRYEYFKAHEQAILDTANITFAKAVKSYTPVKTMQYHRVRRGETLGGIANRYRVSTGKLRAWNNIRGSMIYPGQRLVVYGGKPIARKSTSSTPKPKPKPYKVDPNAKYHTVRSGDTLWDIANKYEGVTVQKIKQLNNMRSSRLEVGQRLRIK